MRRLWSLVCCVLVLASLECALPLAGQDTPAPEATRDEDARERAVIERFVAVLEKNPRRGTALDKVYAFHVERGSLESTIAAYRAKADQGSGGRGVEGRQKEAASTWMIVGLLESLRGQEVAALEAFGNAERFDGANALAAYYLGQTLVLVGQSDKAVEAFERAIARQPARADLLEMFQALGRIHQRTARADKALEVWNRLEQQFPNDERVQEQIATTLLEEEAFDAALPRFEKLAQTAKDRSRQLAFRMEAADIRVRLGQTDAALKEFEQLLSQLNPDHWIYRDIRRRIETIYLRTEDRAGLAAYYEAWLAKHPDDLDAIARVAKVYAALGRDASAREWLERGVKLAPSRKELRRALIDRLIEAHKFAEAVAHYEQLDRHEPNNPDTLRDWGRALLKDPQRDEAARRQAAASVWRKLAEARPNDPLVASQVGDLLRQAELIDEAVEQYRRAIALAPEASQYREYLGEYFHSLKRPDDALATWRPMAEGNRRTAVNLARLAEVLAGFKYVEEAIANNAEACRLDPKDFGLQLKQADLLARAERHEEAIKQLTIVEKLIANDEEREAWLSRDLRALQAVGKLKERIAVVRGSPDPAQAADRRSPASVAATEGEGDVKDKGEGRPSVQRFGGVRRPAPNDIADRWYWLARAYEVDAQPKLAAQAVMKASGLAPRSIPILRASARMLEAQRNQQAAAEVYARLVTLDRRYRTEYLQQLATLERQLGRRDKALQAGRDLIAAAPDNPEIADFFAQLCFQLNAVDEGLNALRRSARANSGDPLALVRLATALLERQRTTEAVDLLWRAFDKSQKLDDRLAIVQKLAGAYSQTGQPERLIERLTRLRRERSQRREMTLCLAQAHQTLGSDTLAQKELESLLSEETRDPSLFTQLCALAEKRQDWTTAAHYQRQLWRMTQDKRDRYHLAQLLMKSGDSDSAVELLTTEAGARELTAEVLKLLDGLYESRKQVELLAQLTPLRQRFPDSWELLYREGVAQAEDRPERAVNFFEKIIALNRPDDEPSLLRAGASTGAGLTPGVRLPLIDRMARLNDIRSATAFFGTTTYVTTQVVGGVSRRVAQQKRLRMWSPDDYGEARLAAWGWLNALATRHIRPAQFHERAAEFAKRLDELEQMPSDTREVLVDQLAVAAFRGNAARRQQLARTLALLPDAGLDAKVYYLQTLGTRHMPTYTLVNNRAVITPANPAPLEATQVDEAMAIYREVARDPAVVASSVAFLSTVLSELKLLKKTDEADALLAAAEVSATTDSELVALSELAATGLRTEAVLRLLDRLIALRQQAGSPPVAQTSRGVSRTTQVMLATGQVVSMQLASGQWVTNTSSAPLMPLAEFLAKADRRDDLLAVWSRHLRLKALSVTGKLGSSSSLSGTRSPGFMQLDVNGRAQLLGWTDVFDGNDAQLLVAVSVRPLSTGPDFGLLQVFRTQAEAPDISRAERVIWLFARAHLLWWRDDRKAALSVLAEAVDLIPERIDLRLNLAHLHEFAGQPTEALAVVEAIVSDSPDVRHDCEQRALRLALTTNRRDRAKVAAERLSGLKLPPQELLPLAEQMLRLDMPEQAEALLSRATTPTQGDARAMRLLMDIQLQQDRLDGATQTAMTLLQELNSRGGLTTTNATVQYTSTFSGRIAGQPVNSGLRALSSNETIEYRMAVYKVLSRTGKLTELIEEAEAKLKRLPTAEGLIATLISYHTADENRRRVDELILKRHEIELNRPSNRYAAAIKCLELDRPVEAIAHIKLLIEKEPAYFATRCTDTVFRFDERKQIPALTELFGQIDWSLYDQHPQILPKVVELLMARADLRDHGTKLFLREWQARPYRRIEMLHRFLSDDLWKLKEVSDGLRQIPFPTDAADVANQWSVFGRVLRHESDGTVVVTVLNRILTALADRGELDAFAGDIEKRLAEWPKWTAGRVLLALVDLRRNRIEAGRDALDGLLPALTKQFLNSPAHAWEIAQELTRHDAGLDVGIRYYELALRERGVEMWTSSSSSLTSTSSPGRAIIKSLTSHGRQRDARRLLLRSLPAGVQRSAEVTAHPTSVELHVAQWIGRELRALGFSIDAIQVYQAALHRSEGMAIGGYDPRVDLQSSLVVAFGELKPASLAEHLAIAADEPPQLDLQLFVTEPKSPAIKLRSRWTPVLETIAESAETAALKTVLAKARARHPDDLPTLILATQLALAMKDVAETKSLVAALVRHVEQHPLEELSTMPHLAAKQRAAAQPRVGLWLIARDCLTVPELKAAANTLTAAAVAAASQQSNADFAAAITAELERSKPPTDERPK